MDSSFSELPYKKLFGAPSNIEFDPNLLNLSLKHLQLELVRIDILIRREVRRWELANQSPADSFRGFYTSHEDAKTLLNRSLCTSWGQTVTLPPEEDQMFAKAYAEAERQAHSMTETAKREGKTLRLTQLATIFDLDRFEVDALLICLAPTLDLRYEQIYGYLQDHVARKRPGVNLILNLLGQTGAKRLPLMSYFSDETPLFKYQILKRVTEPGQVDPPLLSQVLAVDQTIVSWLWGDYEPSVDLKLHVTYTAPKQEEIEHLLTDEGRQNLLNITANKPVAVFYGPDQGSQQAAAQFIAAQMKRPLLMANLPAIVGNRLSSLQAVRLVLRDAQLIGAVPYLFGWDVCLEEKKTPPYLLAELCAYPDVVIVAGQENWQSGGLSRERPILWQGFIVPEHTQRRALWRHFLATVNTTTEPSHLDTTQLSDQFYLTTDQIRDAVTTARDTAIQRGSDLVIDDLFHAARIHSSTRLASLAQKINPRYDWDDIILPEDQITLLREIVNTVRGRSIVLESWEVGKKLAASKGVTMLFGGPPGTGKTMAAEVMARNLGLDLYKIDLSTLVSKYIGETEKNLERIFKEAESSNAILFFDEADSLFGKRSEVRDSHDRYANIEISYLLQRMEIYDGVTILATNLRANLDEAFTRRIHFAVGFPPPDEDHRLRIWQTLFPASVPRSSDVDLGLMARRFELAGGNIRNIIVSAAYLAAYDGGQVNMGHLMHSTSRELQKMGRLVKEADMRFN